MVKRLAMDRLPKIVLVLPKLLVFTCAQHPKERVEEKSQEVTHPIHLKMVSGLRVKIELLRPCGTELFISIASSSV
jgi:hypothetical protein